MTTPRPIAPQPVTLLTWTGACDTCTGLLQLAGRHAAGMVGFFYAPRTQARFFRLDGDGQALDQNGQPLGLGDAYEVRLFDGKRDIRGRKDGDRWRVAVVRDETAAAGASDAVAVAMGLGDPAARRCCYHRGQTYLLWGKARDGAGPRGWTKLTAARIGPLWAPHDIERGCDGIVITAREYFREASDGNVVFAAERLTGFRGIKRGDAPVKPVEEAFHAG